MIRSGTEFGVSYRPAFERSSMPQPIHRVSPRWFCATIAICAAPVVWAQLAPAPTTYSVTAVNSMMGQPIEMLIYRDGDKAVIDHPKMHTRALYNLKAHTTLTWDTEHPDGCGQGSFTGDWGDPFQSDDVDAILKESTTPPGSDTVHGIATKVYEGTDPKSKLKIKVWRETKYGLILKADMTPPGGAATTILETTKFSFIKPAAALFVPPPACAHIAPPAPTADQRFAKETGEPGTNFDDGTMPPGSPNSCSMLMRFVSGGTMQPLSDFQVALDLAYNQDKPASYTMGGSASGRTVFSGGQLKEYTAQIRNGVLRVDNVPPYFDFEVTFAGGNKGASSALLYRHCSGPQTVLLFVVKNPNQISDGADFLWVKSGKFATIAAH